MIACKKSIALHNRPDKKCAWFKSIDLFLHGKSLDTPLYLVFVIKICPQWVLTIIGLWKIQEFCIHQRMVDFVQNLPFVWIENPLSRNIKWDLMICRLFDIFIDDFRKLFKHFTRLKILHRTMHFLMIVIESAAGLCSLLNKKVKLYTKNIGYTSTVN